MKKQPTVDVASALIKVVAGAEEQIPVHQDGIARRKLINVVHKLPHLAFKMQTFTVRVKTNENFKVLLIYLTFVNYLTYGFMTWISLEG